MKIGKRQIIFLIIVLIVMLLGATYAYFFLLVSSEEDSTELYTGTLVVDYSQGDIIYNQAFYPRKQPTLDDVEYAYSNSFKIKNTGSLDGILSVRLDVEDNGFSNNAIKYAIYNYHGYKIISGGISKNNSVVLLNNVRLNSGQETEYTLLLWLEETGQQQNTEEDKRLTATIVADLVQYVE